MYAVIDCNNFFVSCERIFQPKYEKRPVVVLSNNDGCIISRSQEAKDLGIPMAAPAFKYQTLFQQHHVQVFSANFSLYGDISSRVMQLIARTGMEMEVYSIDEAFLRFDGWKEEHIIQHMVTLRQQILKQVGVPVSIGIGQTKTLAKAANEVAKKKDGVSLIAPTQLNTLPVQDIWGIGRKLTVLLNDRGIFTAAQLIACDDRWIQRHLSLSGLKTIQELRGVPCIHFEDVRPAKKSIISSKSFGKPVYSFAEMREAVATFTARAAEKLREEKEVAGHLGVSVTTNFHRMQDKQYYNSYSVQLSQPTSYTPELISTAVSILATIFKEGYRYKKALVYLFDLQPEDSIQLGLLSHSRIEKRQKRLMRTVDGLQRELGSGSIQFGTQGIRNKWQQRRQMRSPRYTTHWQELKIVS